MKQCLASSGTKKMEIKMIWRAGAIPQQNKAPVKMPKRTELDFL